MQDGPRPEAREISQQQLSAVATMANYLAGVYAGSDECQINGVHGKVAMLAYMYLDAGKLMNSESVEGIPGDVWHVSYTCRPKSLSETRRRDPYTLHLLIGQQILSNVEQEKTGQLMRYVGVAFWREAL